jgi:ABC-type methionine transport system ATPase subunit
MIKLDERPLTERFPVLEMRNVVYHAGAAFTLTIPEVKIQPKSHALGHAKSNALGHALCFAGESGSGKSTALKIAAGLLPPDKGAVFWRGRNIGHLNRAGELEFRRDTGFVFQDAALWQNVSLHENLDLPLRLHFPKMAAPAREARIKKVVSWTGFTKSLVIRPALLSPGEQKLVGFARALVCGPKILFLDEWTASLDSEAAERLTQVTALFKKSGGTLVFASHDITLIKSLADDIVVMENGKIREIAALEA